MHAGLHRALLRTFARLPVGVRRRLVRTIAPSYTVGAMCFVERSDGALLLVRHSYRRRWGVPGGLLERGEEPAVGAVREAAEETGVAVVLVGEPTPVVEPVPQRIDLVFRGRLAADCPPEAARPCSAEIEEVGWFAPGELPELQHETAQAMVALARRRSDVDPAGSGFDGDAVGGDR
ncbi:MAG: NUDIX domain-containing protein [Acidimicrobiales bacterium]|nr:NUDIX domain-containing protein [Acidimicrobiales bacterium]